MEHRRGGLSHGRRRNSGRATGGLSLIEVLIVVSFLAIVTAIAVPSISRLVSASNYQTAKRNLNYLNGAVIACNQATKELTTSVGNSAEQTVFNTLRYRDAVNPTPGSPYLPETATYVASSGTNTYRAQWNGRMFKMLPPGSNGAGLDLMKIMGGSVPSTSTNNPFSAP